MVTHYTHDKEIEALTRDELDLLQMSKLQTLLQHVEVTNPFFSRLWSKHGVDISKIRSLSDFRNIPTVEKSDFIADQEETPPFGTRLGSVLRGGGEGYDLHTTSGTSGQGTEVHAQSLRELADMQKMYSFNFVWAGMSPGDIVLLTIPITMMAGGRVEYQSAVGNGMPVLPVGNHDAARKMEHIERFKPKALYGGRLTSLISRL
jgi:phenylacetate-CoA ligase